MTYITIGRYPDYTKTKKYVIKKKSKRFLVNENGQLYIYYKMKKSQV